MSRSFAAALAVPAILMILGVSLLSQQRQPQPVLVKMGANDYDVVKDFALPYPKAGYAWGSVPGVFVESDDRILVAIRGEIKLPDPLPAGYLGFFGSLRSALNSPETEMRNCLRVIDGNGKILETWSQWDRLFEGTNGPHKIKISPYDPRHRVWVVGETRNVIYVFSNDGKQLLQTLGEENVAADDEKHFGKPQDVAFLPDGSVLVADGLTNARIVKLDRNGKYLTSWGGKGTGPGQFGNLHAVDVDRNRRIYAADRAGKRIEVFDENGKFLAAWPNIRFPNHIFVSDAGQDVWVADNMTAEVLKYDTSGNRLFSWDASGAIPGGFGELHQFSVDSKGNVYTADNVLGRLQKLTPKAGADPKHLIGPGLKLMPKIL